MYATRAVAVRGEGGKQVARGVKGCMGRLWSRLLQSRGGNVGKKKKKQSRKSFPKSSHAGVSGGGVTDHRGVERKESAVVYTVVQ